MGSLSDALFKAGLVTEGQLSRQKIQEGRRKKKEAAREGCFCSVNEFLDDVKRRLIEGYSDGTMKGIFTEAHWVADTLALNRAKRSRLHAFLCRIKEQLPDMDTKERAAYLDREMRKY